MSDVCQVMLALFFSSRCRAVAKLQTNITHDQEVRESSLGRRDLTRPVVVRDQSRSQRDFLYGAPGMRSNQSPWPLFV
jgi:hypothetical protein